MKEIKSKNENFLDILFHGYFLDYKFPKIDHEDLLRFLIKGGFPEIQFIETDRMRYLWFSSYISTYVEKDIRDIGELRNMDKFYRIFRLLASRSGNLLNKTEVARDAGVEIKTLENYIQLLITVYQIKLLSPYYSSINKRVIKSPKVYFWDSGLLCYLLGITSVKELKSSPYLGRIFETFVFAELYKATKNSTILSSLHFYRTTDKTEIDFIIERQNEVIAIEIKFSKTVTRHDIRTIINFKNKEKNFKYGFVIYTGDKIFSLGENIFALPIGVLF
jgi:predicted AAA+ superfamily ATPase